MSVSEICLLNPALQDNNGNWSFNLGDVIIQDAVLNELSSIFKHKEIKNVSTHVNLRSREKKLIKKCQLKFCGGSNLLESNMLKRGNLWAITPVDIPTLKNTVLLGVGSRAYRKKINFYTKVLFKNILSKHYIHSVRDEHAKQMLQSIGIQNVINTGCPTMWPLADLDLGKIPQYKSENVLVMLTDYSQKPDLDRKLLELLVEKYERVFAWPQGRFDADYISDMNLPINILEHSLKSLHEFINSDLDFDYIGTRLHGGVKCLVSKKRTLIIEVDHRAREISNDTGLPTSSRDDFEFIRNWIDHPYVTNIKLRKSEIDRWKNQF